MVKSIIKEIIIMLLLCVAILLILGVLFYDYIPSNKVVPSKIAYSTPENIQEEINEEVIEANKTKITYEVTPADVWTAWDCTRKHFESIQAALYKRSRRPTGILTRLYVRAKTIFLNPQVYIHTLWRCF